MEEQAMDTAMALVDRYLSRHGSELIDGRCLVHVALSAFLAGSGVPTDEAAELAERLAVSHLTGPVPRNPMYHGLPWLVSGPVSGVPYYADEKGATGMR